MNRIAALLFLTTAAWAAKAPLPIAELKRTTPVDFDREVRPFLSDNCLACHCQTTTKGRLNMETPELMRKGGESGPAIVPGKGLDSLLLQAAAHLDEDIPMPPRDNKAKAQNLTPEQLGLLKLWIDQGAVASPKRERMVTWQPLAENLGAIFSVAVSGDGQFAACSRANRLFIYHVPSGQLVLNEAAHRDHVNALAFSPDGTLLASGGYREVKLWRLTKTEGKPAQPLAGAAGKITRADGQRFITLEGNVAKLCAADGAVIAELRGNRFARELIDDRDRVVQVATANVAYRTAGVQAAEKAHKAAQERVKKAIEAIPARHEEYAAKQKALAEAKAAKTSAEQALSVTEAELKNADAALQALAAKAAQVAAAFTDAIKGVTPVDAVKQGDEATAAVQAAAKARTARDQAEARRKQAADKIEPAVKQLAAAEDAARKATILRDGADTELALAKAAEKEGATKLQDANAALASEQAALTQAKKAVENARQAATGAEQPIRAATFTADGRTVVTAGDDKLIHTWSAESGAAFDVLAGHKAPIIALAIASSGELVSTASDGSALAWTLTPQWKLERTIGSGEPGSPLADRVNTLAFTRDGKQLATGGGEPTRAGEIKLWDVATGQLVRDFPKVHSDTVLTLEFSPDDQQLASGAADKMARIIDLKTRKVARNFEGHTHHILGVSWSAEGRILATAGADNVVKVWDVTTGDRKKNIDGYDKEVTAVRFLAATATLVTSSGDNKVRIVGVDGKEVRAFPDVADFMHSAAVTNDGKLVVAGGQDSVLRVWNAGNGKTLAAFPAPKTTVTRN